MTLTSFDLGIHPYTQYGKEYIDSTFPNRHTLILGDSTKTVPQFIDQNPTLKFDVIFIDGGHKYNIAKADLHLATHDTVVILDDTCFSKNLEEWWTIGPTRTWLEHLQTQKIRELGREEYERGCGMSWGNYLF